MVVGGWGKGRQSPSTPRSGSQECNVVAQAICGTAGGSGRGRWRDSVDQTLNQEGPERGEALWHR